MLRKYLGFFVFFAIIFLISFSSGLFEGDNCTIEGSIADLWDRFLLCENLVWKELSFSEIEERVSSGKNIDMDSFNAIKIRMQVEIEEDDYSDRARQIIIEQREKSEKEKAERETAVEREREQRELNAEYLKRIDMLIYLIIVLVIIIIGFIAMFLIHLFFKYRKIRELKEILYKQHKSKVRFESGKQTQKNVQQKSDKSLTDKTKKI
jgi:ABC-type antimicrobial peptide transport system permease subunit